MGSLADVLSFADARDELRAAQNSLMEARTLDEMYAIAIPILNNHGLHMKIDKEADCSYWVPSITVSIAIYWGERYSGGAGAKATADSFGRENPQTTMDQAETAAVKEAFLRSFQLIE